MTAQRQREVNVFRYVPSTSPVHGMWAGTKLVLMGVMSITLLAKPTWAAIGIAATVVALYAVASRLPRTVTGSPPRWLYIGLGISGALSFLAFGPPNVHLGSVTIGLGGLLDFLRFTALGLVLVAMGLLLGWTTQLADVGTAVDVLATPARLVRLPVDEFVLAIGLSVRCLPLLADDIRTLRAAWRVRAPVRHMALRERVQELRDLLVAALVSSLRRAREMADAIDARGGPRHARREHVRLHSVDAVPFLVVAGAVVAMIRV